MSYLSQIAKTQLGKLPEVTGYVVTNDGGALLDASGDLDGEALGAVHVVALQALSRCGDTLGLGSFGHFTVSGSRQSCLITARDHDVLGVYLDSAKPLAAFEKKLEPVLKR